MPLLLVQNLRVETLASLTSRPTAALPGLPPVQSIGSLQVREIIAERSATFLTCQDQFTLLVDQFKFAATQAVELNLEAPSPLLGSRHRFRCCLPDESGEVTVHVLGDYPFQRLSETELVVRQRLAQGRFLIVVTRDSEARVRLLNGWSIEVRSRGQVFQLLHSNRSRKLRPLGPVQTDAPYALIDWPQAQPASPTLDFRLHGLQASQLHADLRTSTPPPAPDWTI
jgi:hypothetical protein